MKILVYSIAAESGGALTILNSVYENAKNIYSDIEWVFMVSIVDLKDCANIKVLKFPQIKKNWVVRYFFDKLKSPKIIKEIAPDIVLNLQNIYIKSKCRQILYMHQTLPFVDYKFKIKDFHMWFYQNIIGAMIKKSCRKADEIIVQTKWIRDSIVLKTKVDVGKIRLQAPTVDKSKLLPFIEQEEKQYFFPAIASVYKNHKVIIDALELLSKKNIFPKVVFTLLGNETKLIQELKNRSDTLKLNVIWKGTIKYEDVLKMYSKSVLLFPSFIESFGLPLMEAKLSNCPIIAADTPFAREICENYSKSVFFDKFDYEQLSLLLS